MLEGLDFDWRLRLAAFDRIRQLSGATRLVTSAQLDTGFEFEGQRFPLWSKPRGIWRPQVLARELGAALTVVTSPPVPGKKSPYDDQVGSDEPFFIYRYQGDDPDDWDNVAVRNAYKHARPVIYLYGISKGVYDAICPCYIVGDDPAGLAFRLETDAAFKPAEPASALIAARREYATRTVKVRLHQERFRELVVGAYRSRCAVCTLRHPELLDAAHILPDRDERGRPEVPNGLALCKIHHGAYDSNILGTSPDYKVEIRGDVLKEKDGPMLQHGLQAMHAQPLLLPTKHELRPNREYLAERFSAFQAA